MELGYRLTITDSKNNSIFLSSMKEDTKENGRIGDITMASYKSNTLNDDTLSRSNDVRAEIKIYGVITNENKDITCSVASWAKETDTELIYRKVKLVAYSSTDPNAKLLRSYEIENMFVLDYEETFKDDPNNGGDGSSGVFVLYVVQKKGNFTQYIETQ